MMVSPGTARVLAGIVAVVALVGLGVQLYVSTGLAGSVPGAFWTMSRYFTIISNVLVALLFTGLAFGRRDFASPVLIGGVTLAIMLVGVVFSLLLSDLHNLTGAAELANTMLHKVTPVIVPLFWLVAAPKGGLRWRDPWLWTLLPLAYFGYALARGGVEHIYAYPFMDLAQLGLARTVVNATVIAAGFLVTGYLLVWIDRRLSH